MKCPYCNKKLKHFVASAYGYYCGCDKTDGMIGTELMWEKVASLAKIRNAGERYRASHKQQKAEYMRKWCRKRKGEINENI